MTKPAPHSQFRSPTADQLRERFEQYPLRGPAVWATRAPLLLLGFMAVVVLFAPGILALILPWLALAGLFVYLSVRMRIGQAREQQVVRLFEGTLLRRYPGTLRRAWELLPEVATNESQYGRTVSVMARCLEDLAQHEAAMVAYDHLLTHVPPNAPAGLHLRLQRTISALGADHLSDADDALRQLRGRIDTRHPNPLTAMFRMARLVQDVQTAHFDDAVDAAHSLVAELRPLGIDAGYGYALMALCYEMTAQAAERSDAEDAAEQAAASRTQKQVWWERATLLLPQSALAYRYPQLQAIIQQEDAVEA